ncbi:Cytochrome P450 OS=Streptomyces alboniger OX=132473 GN=CP975_14260 PE=3 SV=1 [Streptomyces alboniger]
MIDLLFSGVAIVLLLAAGYWVRGQRPESLKQLRTEPERLASSLDELLRFDSPVGIATFRYSTEELTLGGTVIPAGVPVLIAPGAANRDDNRFPAPDQLDLDRDAGGHLAFGHGIHRCLGAPLARAEGELALRAVFPASPTFGWLFPQRNWSGGTRG